MNRPKTFEFNKNIKLLQSCHYSSREQEAKESMWVANQNNLPFSTPPNFTEPNGTTEIQKTSTQINIHIYKYTNAEIHNKKYKYRHKYKYTNISVWVANQNQNLPFSTPPN